MQLQARSAADAAGQGRVGVIFSCSIWLVSGITRGLPSTVHSWLLFVALTETYWPHFNFNSSMNRHRFLLQCPSQFPGPWFKCNPVRVPDAEEGVACARWIEDVFQGLEHIFYLPSAGQISK